MRVKEQVKHLTGYQGDGSHPRIKVTEKKQNVEEMMRK